MKKKIISLLTVFAVFATLAPTALAGGSAVGITMADGSPSGYAQPGTDHEIMRFNLEAWMDVDVTGMTARIDGSGANYIDGLKVKDEDGNVIASDSTSDYGYYDFDMQEMFWIDDVKQYSIVADISDSAAAVSNLSFSVAITDVEVVDPYTGNNGLSTWELPLKGATFDFGGLFSADADFTNFAAVKANRIISVGSTGNKISSFWIDYTQSIDVEEFEVQIKGNGYAGVKKVYIKNQNGDILDSGVLNAQGYITFDTDYLIKGNAERFDIFVDANANAKIGTEISSWIQDVKISTSSNGDDLYVGNDVPYNDNPFVFVAAGTPSKQEYEQPIVIPNYEEYVNPFSDVTSAQAKTLKGRAALYLAAKDIIEGYLISSNPLNVEFQGGNELNRAEATKFIVNSLDKSEYDYCYYSPFNDFSDDEWYTKYVCTAYELGIVSGNPDGSFQPGRKVNKAEFVKMLVRAHGLKQNMAYNFNDVKKTDWYSPYAGVVQDMGLFPDDGNKFNATKVLNRWETAVAVYLVLTAS